MISKQVIKKLFKVATYLSPVISALVITPKFISGAYSPALYIKAFLMILFIVYIIWSVNILLTYLLSKRNTNKDNNLIKYLLSYSVCGIFSFLLSRWIYYMFMMQGEPHRKLQHFHVIIFFSINTIILILQDLILTKERNAIIEIENMQLKMKNLEAYNQQLKQQVHPHFLFNSLSTLKTLISNSPEQAEDYLIKLSDLLRNSISSNTLNVIKVAKELRSCSDYLEMQKIRFGNALQFSINIPTAIADSHWVPVFSIHVLAENAIKHNTFTIQAPLHINIVHQKDMITVNNTMQPRKIPESSAGIGLANLDERYKILCGEGIIINNADNIFSVSIKIFDDENCYHRR